MTNRILTKSCSELINVFTELRLLKYFSWDHYRHQENGNIHIVPKKSRKMTCGCFVFKSPVGNTYAALLVFTVTRLPMRDTNASKELHNSHLTIFWSPYIRICVKKLRKPFAETTICPNLSQPMMTQLLIGC